MPKRHQIAKLFVDGNTLDVTATVEDDGSLTIFELSYGPAADAWYGEGRDIEVWLTIPPKAVQQLSEHLFGQLVDNPADGAAQLLAANYEGDGSALRKIQEVLDQNDIRYERVMWT